MTVCVVCRVWLCGPAVRTGGRSAEDENWKARRTLQAFGINKKDVRTRPEREGEERETEWALKGSGRWQVWRGLGSHSQTGPAVRVFDCLFGFRELSSRPPKYQSCFRTLGRD